MDVIDLNCDMGESFGAWTMGSDAEMLKIVSSANVACGFHGGDPLVMFETVTRAKENDVGIGAHPSFFDVWGFGRRQIQGEKPEDIEKAGMRADPDTVLLGARHRVEHDERITAVKSACDIRRRDDFEHLGVAAHRPGAKTLAHIAIQVDHIHRVPPLGSRSINTLYMGGLCR